MDKNKRRVTEGLQHSSHYLVLKLLCPNCVHKAKITKDSISGSENSSNYQVSFLITVTVLYLRQLPLV